jgi:hypothetical protein
MVNINGIKFNLTYPLDFLTTRMQLQNELGKAIVAPQLSPLSSSATASLVNNTSVTTTRQLSFLKMASHVIQTEGFSSLYAGASIAMTRQIFNAGVSVGLYADVRAMLMSKEENASTCALYKRALAGGITGSIAQLFSNPTDVIRVRLQADGRMKLSGLQKRYNGAFDATKKIVFVTGGSLGAGAINKGIASHIEALIEHDIQVIWQTGKFYVDAYKKYEADYPTHLRVLDFLPNIDAAYAAADVVVSRAGGTISELAILGKPSILLPSPNVAEDHQTHNVMSLVNHRAAILVKDKEANDTLVNTIIALVNNEEQQKELRKNISAMAKPNAAIDIAKAVLKLIQEEK